LHRVCSKRSSSSLWALIIASLVAIETVDAKFDALHVHMKGLKRHIRLLGSIDALDHMTLYRIQQYVLFQTPIRC
jgi:hypothetical protein